MAVEQTSKTWKLTMLAGSLAMLFAFGNGCWQAIQERPAEAYTVPIIIFVSGLFVRCVGSMGKWWFNE